MKLIGRTGRIAGTDVAVNELLRIGAAPDNDFRVMVSGVSRHHARIVKQGDSYWLEDAGSTNGTFLNGLRIARERLRHLDVITLGRDVDLITVATEQPGAVAPLVKAVEDAWLEPTETQQGGPRVEIPAGETTLGRLAPANCILESPVIGRLHARITRTADHVVIEDVGSVNGTFVNGTRISAPTVLGDGDTISIAGVRFFRAHIVGSARRPQGPQQVVAAQTQVFDADWKTRLVWSAEELAELERERQRIVDAVRKEQGAGAAPAAPVAATPAGAPAPKAPAAPKPAAAAAKPAAAAPSPKPAAAPPAPKAIQPPAAAPVQAEKPSPAPPPAKPEEQPQAPRPEIPKAAAPKAEEPKPSAPRPESPKPEPAKPAPPPAVQVVAPDEAPTRLPLPSPRDAATIQSGAATIVTRRVRAVKLTGEKGAFQLEPGKHAVGRAETAAVPILDPQVSRNHATLTITASEARVEDGGSSNGTFVNGVRVPAGGSVLKTGDKLRFGAVEFTIELM